jgi:N6-L-threonylcarbamoyladenine synthase
MAVLGIESTAHTFGVGIVEDPQPGRCKVLSNIREMVRPQTGGIHPREAANHHADKAAGIIRQAFDEAKVPASAIEAIAFSQGPGLGPCLRTGATAARTLALALDVPLVGVNHCVAHLEIGKGTTEAKDPLLLYASGGNTQVIAFSHGRYRVYGETLDVGIGNMLDKFARDQGIPFPGGPKLEQLAKSGKKLLDIPYPVKGMDTAFSGVLNAANTWIQKGESIEDVAFSIQETCFAALTEVTERALAQTAKTEVLLGGGVACNERLSDMVRSMATERGCGFHRPTKPLLVDNGAMIAWTGLLIHRSGGRTTMDASIVDQRYRTDQVQAVWM